MEKNQNILTMREAAKASKCTTAAIFAAIKSKRLAAHRVGFRWYLHRDDLQSYKKTRYSRQYSKYKGKPLFEKEKGERSATDAAKEVGSTVQMMYHYLRCRRLPFKKKGVAYVLDAKDIESFKQELEKSSKLNLTAG